MPHSEIEKYIWIVEILIGLATTIWGILTYRVWDLQKAVGAKVDFEKFDTEVKYIQNENKKDLRYYEEKMTDQLKVLADDLKDEIRSIK